MFEPDRYAESARSSPEPAAREHYELAVRLIQARQFDRAEELLQSLFARFPDNAAVCFQLGTALFAQNRLADALEMLTRARHIESNSLPILMSLGRVLCALGRIAESVALGEAIVRLRYFRTFGRHLDVEDPKSFTEKLFSRMIMFHRQPVGRFTQLSDKFRVRDHVADKLGPGYLSKLIWVGTDVPALAPRDLPWPCVLKANHGSGMVKILASPADHAAAISLSSQWLAQNFYWRCRECQYLGIERRLMIEELLRDGYPDGPLDYRFYCFDGKPKLVQVDDHPHSINTFYDLGWKKVDLAYRPTFRPFEVERPSNFGEMCDVAAALSEGFSFVRVDLYNCAGRVVFGELTFTPASGVLRFKPQNWDMALGAMWNYQPRIGQY